MVKKETICCDRDKADIHLWSKNTSQPKQQWRLDRFNQNYLLVNRLFNTRVASVESNPHDNKADIHLWQQTSTRERQQWRLERTNDVVNNNIANAQRALVSKQQQLKQAQADLQDLNHQLSVLNLDDRKEIEEKIATLQARHEQVIKELKAVQEALNQLNNEFLESI
ncbi:MAG: hypothetical protein GVY17_09050 [Cyanobacteria bacterium]|jgi:peptidoglycan hydrolase CwlO-like protein|nr:hypothetical protein [Cyanobacteria bacterium GSL.Bin21]